MALQCVLCAFLVVAIVASSPNADTDEGKLTNFISCLTTKYINTIREKSNVALPACEKDSGLIYYNATAETASTGRPARATYNPKAILCFMECFWGVFGLTKDGSFVIEDFTKNSVKPEYQEKVTSKFNECLTKEGLSTTYPTTSKEDYCESLERYDKCADKAFNVCRADGSSGKEED